MQQPEPGKDEDERNVGCTWNEFDRLIRCLFVDNTARPPLSYLSAFQWTYQSTEWKIMWTRQDPRKRPAGKRANIILDAGICCVACVCDFIRLLHFQFLISTLPGFIGMFTVRNPQPLRDHILSPLCPVRSSRPRQASYNDLCPLRNTRSRDMAILASGSLSLNGLLNLLHSETVSERCDTQANSPLSASCFTTSL